MNTQTFAEKMYVSRRTAARWASQGIARATKKNGAWIFEDGEPERIRHDMRVEAFLSAGMHPDVAEMMAYLLTLPEEERDSARATILRISKAIRGGADQDLISKAINERRYEDVGLDAMLEECMPSQA